MAESAGSDGPGAALLTDRYELTMLDSALADGTAGLPAVYEVFTRSLPAGRRYGVTGGLGRIAPTLAGLRFNAEDLAWLATLGVVAPATLAHLEAWRFSGTVRSYREGEIYTGGSPILQVRTTFGEGLLLETLLLSVLNHDSAIAAAASRMHSAAGDRPLIEMGSRRTHELAAVAAARTAWLCGFASSSNLAAGRLHGVPTAGTAAHAWILAHDDERSAVRAQLTAQGTATTVLVDTYDIAGGIRVAVAVAQEFGAKGPGGVRLDSGDPALEVPRARALLDSLGAVETRITVTGDLDEYALAGLAAVPVDSYGIGTRLVTGSGRPTAGLVYKLVEVNGRPVAKTSVGKASQGGAKTAHRLLDGGGRAIAELVGPARAAAPDGAVRPLLVTVIEHGELLHDPSAQDIRAHHVRARAELPAGALDVSGGAPALPTREVT